MPAETTERNELKRVNSYQWPAAHIGHLTEGQQGALEKFRALCEEKGYYTPGNDKTPATHDDETLLRYLRARKFIHQYAFQQFKETEDWRDQNKIDELYETIDIDEYEQARRLYPQWTGRRDKRGIPYYIFEVAHLKAKEVAVNQSDKGPKGGAAGTSKTPRKMLRLFALYENLCRFVLPMCSALPDRPNRETPVSQSNNIVDISKVSLRQFWNLRVHMQDASNLATAHYPETLDRIFIVGAPSFFPTVWEWVKNWFDPITVAKIFILKNANMKSTLEKYIDPEDLPKKYGGNLDWEFGDMPALEPAIANSLRWKEDIRQKDHRTLPIGPIKWQYDKDGDLVAVAIGTENGQRRHRVLAALHPEAGVTRLALSPGRAPVDTTAAPLAAVVSEGHKNPPANGHAVPTMSDSIAPTTTTASAPTAATDDGPSQTDAFSVPYKDSANGIHHPPADSRQGTSESRYEQQAATHAHGILEHGTPAVKTDGQGVEHTVMEPRTVGQAPKETPLYDDDDATPQPGLMAQVQQTAGQVAGQAAGLGGAVLSAVGLGGGKQTEAEAEQTKTAEGQDAAGDQRVDGIEPKIVEEYLREQNMSKAGDQKPE